MAERHSLEATPNRLGTLGRANRAVRLGASKDTFLDPKPVGQPQTLDFNGVNLTRFEPSVNSLQLYLHEE